MKKEFRRANSAFARRGVFLIMVMMTKDRGKMRGKGRGGGGGWSRKINRKNIMSAINICKSEMKIVY